MIEKPNPSEAPDPKREKVTTDNDQYPTRMPKPMYAQRGSPDYHLQRQITKQGLKAASTYTP